MQLVRFKSPSLLRYQKIIFLISFLLAIAVVGYWVSWPSEEARAVSPDNRWKVSLTSSSVGEEVLRGDIDHAAWIKLVISERDTGRSLRLNNPLHSLDNIQELQVLWSQDSRRFYCLYRESEVSVAEISTFEIVSRKGAGSPIALRDISRSAGDTLRDLKTSSKPGDRDLAAKIIRAFGSEYL